MSSKACSRSILGRLKVALMEVWTTTFIIKPQTERFLLKTSEQINSNSTNYVLNSYVLDFLGRHSLMAGLIVWSFEGRLFSTLTHLLKKDFVTFRPFFKKMQFFFIFFILKKDFRHLLLHTDRGPLGGSWEAARGC